MSLEFLKAGTADAVSLVAISKRAFDSDVEVGGTGAGGPPDMIRFPITQRWHGWAAFTS